MLTLTDLLVGLEERGDTHRHDMRIVTFNRGDSATLDCANCRITVSVMIVDDLGGWRIRPDIAALDRPCVGVL